MSLKYDNNSSMKTLKYDNKSYTKTLKYDYKKSLKIPKSNQNTYWGKADNTMAKRKKTKTNNDLQNITHKTKHWETRTPLKTGSKLRCSRRVSSYCSISAIIHVTLVTNPVISQEWGKVWKVLTTSWTYSWLFVTQMFLNG